MECSSGYRKCTLEKQEQLNSDTIILAIQKTMGVFREIFAFRGKITNHLKSYDKLEINIF